MFNLAFSKVRLEMKKDEEVTSKHVGGFKLKDDISG